MDHLCCFSLQQPKPTTLSKAPQILPQRQVCLQVNVTLSTKTVYCESSGNCVPWWLKTLATIQRPRSSRTFCRKALQEVGPRASSVCFPSEKLRAMTSFMGITHRCLEILDNLGMGSCSCNCHQTLHII